MVHSTSDIDIDVLWTMCDVQKEAVTLSYRFFKFHLPAWAATTGSTAASTARTASTSAATGTATAARTTTRTRRVTAALLHPRSPTRTAS